jgi:hypothetical protein
MNWLWSWLSPPRPHPQADREAFERREAELRERHERLERMAVEADVISRTDRPEEPRQ